MEIVSVGNFCEIAGSTAILCGGEHCNKKPINHSLLMYPTVRQEIESLHGNFEQNIYNRGPIIIGSGVTISYDVTILSGITIGNGVVIGTGAVVTKDVPPFAIVAGNPAKIIRYRFPQYVVETLETIRWWEYSLDSLAKLYNEVQSIGNADLQRLSDFGNYEPLKYRDCFLVFNHHSRPDAGLYGVQINGRFTAFDDLPEPIKWYFSQKADTGEVLLVNNPFDFLLD